MIAVNAKDEVNLEWKLDWISAGMNAFFFSCNHTEIQKNLHLLDVIDHSIENNKKWCHTIFIIFHIVAVS
jgi:hypothetical protein